MKLSLFAAAAFLLASAAAQPTDAKPFDPRHHFDQRCPAGVKLDPSDKQRDPASKSSYLWTPMPASATASDCAKLCCGDWSCESFAFVAAKGAPTPPPSPPVGLTGDWFNHDSLRGISKIRISQTGQTLSVESLEPKKSMWTSGAGKVSADGHTGYLDFDHNGRNNRTFTASSNKQTLTLSRESFDPAGFTQTFVRSPTPFGPSSSDGCPAGVPCCIFKDDVDALVAGVAGTTSGVRAKLAAKAPPYPDSTVVKGALETHMLIGINGDEFPITWGKDGAQYTGAGDNNQGNGSSPLGFFKVNEMASPKEMGCKDVPVTPGNQQPYVPCKNISLQGADVPVKNAEALKACPAWRKGIPNLKSSGVLSVDGVLYWAISW